MTEPSAPAAAAGWYPDPSGQPGQRWWDGAQWTTQFQQPYSATATASLRAPNGTKPYTIWIWLILLVMLLQLLPLFVVDYGAYVTQTVSEQGAYARVSTTSDPLTILAAWLGGAIMVLFAWYDWRELRRHKVPRPFHWAWMFFAPITPLVYVIGRSVVVRRRTGTGMAPLWGAIGLTVLGWVITAIIVIPAFIRAYQDVLSHYPG